MKLAIEIRSVLSVLAIVCIIPAVQIVRIGEPKRQAHNKAKEDIEVESYVVAGVDFRTAEESPQQQKEAP